MPDLSWGLYHGSESTEQRAKKFVNSLLENDPKQSSSLREFKIASTLFFQKNKTFLHAMRQAFKDILDEIGTELQSETYIDANTKKLARCLKLLPLASIKPNQIYNIPSKNQNGRWEMVTYVVTPIEITPTSGYGRLVLKDFDRLFAYGLAPLKKPALGEASPPLHLIFVDQYPGQQGWLSSLYLRFKYLPGFFQGCQGRIKNWIAKHSVVGNERNTIVHGLGHAGRLALETVFTSDIQPHIAEVDVLEAYATSHSTFLTNYRKKWTDLASKPNVYIQLHKNHYNIGQIMSEWTVKDSCGANLQNQEFIKDAWHNIILGTVLGGIMNTLLSSLQYVFMPLIRAIRDHIVELVLLSILTMVYLMLPGLIMTDIGTFLAIFTACYFAAQLVQPFKVLLGWNEKNEAECHKSDPQELVEKNAELVAKYCDHENRINSLESYGR